MVSKAVDRSFSLHCYGEVQQYVIAKPSSFKTGDCTTLVDNADEYLNL